MFAMRFDITPLMDERGRPKVSGEEMEEILFYWCRMGIENALHEARVKVKNHP